MTKFYTKGATRMYSWDLVEAWAEAEENLGLKNSIFFEENGTFTQWIDVDEGDKFFNQLKKTIKEKGLDEVFENYFEALKEKDKVSMFMCLAFFNEIDEHPEIADKDQLRRLKRIRESTHEEIYKL